MQDMMISEQDVLASICRESFYDFLQQFWSTLIPEPPVWNWHIEYLCNKLQNVAIRVAKRLPKEKDLIINISPGSTKSSIVCVFFPAWVWTWFPISSFIGASYRYDLALELSRRNRNVVKSEKYLSTFRNIVIAEDQDAKGYFVNDKGGARMSVGIGGDIIGRHADFIMIDDPLNPKGARSLIEIESANTFIKETLWSRKKDKLITPTILIMQRLHQYDPTAMLLDTMGSENIDHICLPAEVTDDIQPVELREMYTDGLMDPVRLSWPVLKEAHKMGDFFYSGQYLQNPVPLEGGMFKTEKFIIIPELPKILHWRQRVRYWDKAGTAGAGDYTVGVLMGVDENDKFYVLDVVRGRWDSAQREQIIRATAMIDGPKVEVGIEQEPGSGGRESAENTVKNLAGYSSFIDHPTGDKKNRADPMSAQVNVGNMRLIRAEWNRGYIDEFQHFPHSTYDDQVDASSGSFNRLNRRRIHVGAW